jgi:hypothetical protein
VLFSIRYHLGQSKPPFKVGSLFLPRASGFTIITGRLYRIERRFTSSPPCVRPLFEKARVKARGAKRPLFHRAPRRCSWSPSPPTEVLVAT